MPYFYNPNKLEVLIPPICATLSVIFAFIALIISTVGTGHVPAGIFPSISWAGDVYPESIFLTLAMILTAVQILFLYLSYDRDFDFGARTILLGLVVVCIASLLTLATVSVGNNCTVHGFAALFAFFGLYFYVVLRLFFLWKKCRTDKRWMIRFKQSMWLLVGMFILSVPATICCFVFFFLYSNAALGNTYSIYYLFFVIFEWIAALVVDGMHITTWAAYNIGHTNDLK